VCLPGGLCLILEAKRERPIPDQRFPATQETSGYPKAITVLMPVVPAQDQLGGLLQGYFADQIDVAHLFGQVCERREVGGDIGRADAGNQVDPRIGRHFARVNVGRKGSFVGSEVTPDLREAADPDGPADLLGGHADAFGKGWVGELKLGDLRHGHAGRHGRGDGLDGLG